MKRRTFLRDASLGAIAISAYGFISFDGTKYVGDCETTTDILGPFYRPGSPVRNNLLIPGDAGTKMVLKGKVKHDDCVTPFRKAKIEIWHCSAKGVYDNTTEEFRYRGTTYTDENGNYSFTTILPVPYEIGNNRSRPAHFHLMITADKYQPLITQLYFEGDKHLLEDPSSASPTARKRILKVQSLSDNSKQVSFDISLSKKLAAEVASIDRLTGVYSSDQGNEKLHFIKNNNTLWVKKDPFGFDLEYVGDNTFRYTDDNSESFRFEILQDNKIKVYHMTTDQGGQQKTTIAIKEI